jgi:superfamily I DNA/RNA helicase
VTGTNDDLPSYEDLSEEQDEIYNLPLDGNFLVSGPPGSGKSVMALYRAEALTIDDRSPSILMFNNVLKQYTQRHAAELGIDDNIETFHRWLGALWRQHYHIRPPKLGGDEWSYDWAAMISQFVTAPPERGALNDLLVDEGQDMSLNFYQLTRWICANITVFADENQQLRDENTTLKDIETAIGAVRHVNLRRNYRNSIEIAKLARHFYAGAPTGIPDLPTRSWRPGPVLTRYQTEHGFVEDVADYARTHGNRRIGIAVASKRLQIKLFNQLRHRKVPTETYVSGDSRHSLLDFSTSGVKIINFASLKGLQFDTLFVPELQTTPHDVTSAAIRMRFYVVTSRARNELYLSYIGDVEPPLVRDIPKTILTRK